MRVAIVGLGSIAHKHISALREISPEVEIFALRHNNSASQESGVTNLFSYEDMLAVKPLFVIISNPTSEHYSTIDKLSTVNVPLFIEKPLFSEIMELPKVNSLTYVACNLRFLECLQFLKQELTGKRINEVNVYCGSYLPEWREGIDWRKCYSANKNMGGGIHIDLIHEIDYVYWLFGKPQRVSKSFRNVSSLDITAYDYANYLFEYTDFSASIVLNYYRRDYKRTVEVLTDNETYFVNLAKNSVLCNDNELFNSNQQPIQTYKAQMLYFIDAIEKGHNFNDITEAYEVLKICLDDDTKR